MNRRVDVIGDTYGLLTVRGDHEEPGLKRRHVWCQCTCGRELSVALNNLRSGHTKSCGCHKKQTWESTITTHGLSRKYPEEYKVWKGIRSRCYNTKAKNYKDYGARGITMSDSWAESFGQFLADLGPRPSPHHTVERGDNDGPYSKENCAWATREVQANNRRTNRMVELFGETMTLAEAVRRYGAQRGISYQTALARLNRGASAEVALTAAVTTFKVKQTVS